MQQAGRMRPLKPFTEAHEAIFTLSNNFDKIATFDYMSQS